MLVFLLLEFNVENPFADGEFAEFFDFLEVEFAGLLGDHLEPI